MNITELIQSVTGREHIPDWNTQGYTNMWETWYEGKVASFHNYRIYNGRKYVPMQRASLGMAKRVCEDWANLLINEKTDITLDNEEAQTRLETILEQCHFWRKANAGIEKSFALGFGALVVSVENLSVTQAGILAEGESPHIKVSFVNCNKIIPITFEDDEVKECAFVNRLGDVTYISAHIIDSDGLYKICNITAEGKDDLKAKDFYIFDTLGTEPWFAIIQPNIANNIDINCPLGISVFANAIDILKQTDLIFDSLQNEFALGKKRIFVNARQMSVSTADGTVTDTFDSNDVAFYVLPEPDSDSNVFIQSDTQALRVSDHTEALQAQLNYLSAACGLGTNHYRYNSGNVTTATQVISENSELFRNIKKHEILIEDALITVVKAIIHAANTFTDKPILCDTDKIQIKFDDSIIEDKESEKQSDRLDVQLNIMSRAEYRAKWYNEDIDTAEERIAEIDGLRVEDRETDGITFNDGTEPEGEEDDNQI